MTSLLGAGCAPLPQQARSVLDARTGATLIVADQPLVLARERRDLAAQARDYLTLLAAEINEAGRRRLVLVAHQWSTIDVRSRGAPPPAAQALLVVADGRDLRLTPLEESTSVARDGWNRALGEPENAEVLTSLYPIDAETLRFLAGSSRISAAFPQSQPPLPYAMWRDGRAAQLRLLEAIGQ
jgi:hypothetical protein